MSRLQKKVLKHILNHFNHLSFIIFMIISLYFAGHLLELSKKTQDNDAIYKL